MSVSESEAYATARSRVLRWCELYTHGLDHSVAGARRAELVSDLYEQAAHADSMGYSGTRVARQIRGRAVLGALDDLSWRRDTQHAMRSSTARIDRVPLGALGAILALSLLGWGAFVLGQIGVAVARGGSWPNVDLALTVLLATLACACGIVLILRARTRAIGAVWLAVAAYGIVRYGTKAWIAASPSYYPLAADVPFWNELTLLAAVGTALYFVALAAHWMPAGQATPKPLDHSTTLDHTTTGGQR